MKYFVYAVCHPDDHRPMYIGKTDNIDNRRSSHLNCNSEIFWWVSELKKKDKVPVFKILCNTDTNDLACIIEKQLIDYYSKNHAILNKYHNKNYRLSHKIYAELNSES